MMDTKKPPNKPAVNLTTKQKKLVQGIIEGKTKKEAGELAGYSKKSVGPIVSETLRNPNVQALIESHADDAQRVIYELTMGEKVPHAVRLNGAKDILDRAGFKPKEKTEISTDGPIEIDMFLTKLWKK